MNAPLLYAAVAAAVAMPICVPVRAMAGSVFDGTWKANPQSAVLPKQPDVFRLAGGEYTCVSCGPPYSVKADGMDHPVTGQPYFDTVAITVVDDHIVVEVDKKAGHPVFAFTNTVSPDGKRVTFDLTDTTLGKPLTSRETGVRLAAGPAGSHLLAGAWRETSMSGMSDASLTVTLKLAGGALDVASPVGTSYVAPLDGTEVPIKGDPANTMASVRQTGPRTLVETDRRGGKVVDVLTMRVSADGKTLAFSSHDTLENRTWAYSCTRI